MLPQPLPFFQNLKSMTSVETDLISRWLSWRKGVFLLIFSFLCVQIMESVYLPVSKRCAKIYPSHQNNLLWFLFSIVLLNAVSAQRSSWVLSSLIVTFIIIKWHFVMFSFSFPNVNTTILLSFLLCLLKSKW